MGRYCGILNDSLTFERDGNMSIRFKSDSDKEFHGFRCAYNIFKGQLEDNISSLDPKDNDSIDLFLLDYSTTSMPGSTLYGKHSMYGQTHGKSTRNSSKTLRTDSFRTIKGTYSASTDRIQSTGDSPNTPQTDSFRTIKETYSASTDRIQSTGDSPNTPQTDSFRTIKETYSASTDRIQSTGDSPNTPQTDSFRTIKETYSASTDHVQSTGDSPKTLQTDSLGTAKFTTVYSVSMDHGSLVVIAKSEMASSFQEQTGSSTSQVRLSLSSLSPTLSPSSSG